MKDKRKKIKGLED